MQENEIQVRVQQELAKLLSDPREAIKLYQQALDVSEQENNFLKEKIEKDLIPKVDMYEKVMGDDRLLDMKQTSKILNFKDKKRPGKGLGRNSLFDYLKERGLLSPYKEPYQKYVDAGYFKIIEESISKDNYEGTYLKTVVTQRGVDYIGKLLKEDGYEPLPR
jgi:anti-repressor protein